MDHLAKETKTRGNKKIKQLVDFFDKMLNSPSVPEIPKELADIENLPTLRAAMTEMRDSLYRFSQGDHSKLITLRGFMAGCLKALQANLRHLTWLSKQGKENNANESIGLTGDFDSTSMLMQLNGTIRELQQKEELLLELTKKQQQEAELRNVALYALRQSAAKFKYLAEHDPFTECLNRRSFFSLAERALQNAVVTREPCAIALMDLDSFKALNDTYGHLNGDIALKHVVKVANSRLRNADMIGRYGGEEFIFFFSGVDLKQGATAAERIRHAIADSFITLPNGETLTVTISAGVCTVLPEWPGARTAQYLRKVTEQADNALYRAKLEGKNRVCCAELVPPQNITDYSEL